MRRIGCRILLEDERADRHLDLEVVAMLTRPVGALTVLTAARLELGMKAEVDEGVLARRGNDGDRPAAAAVAAIGAAAGDEFLATETEAAPASVAGAYVNVDFVDEHTTEASGISPQASGLSQAQGLTDAMPETALIPRPDAWGLPLFDFDGNDADAATVRAVVLELHRAGDLGEQRVVLPEADVEARAEAATALADENRSAGDEIAIVALDAQALRVAVAPVTRAALSFFVSHCR